MKLFYKVILSLFIFALIGLRPQTVFAGNPPDAAHSSLTATEVPADGSTTSTVTITLHDSSNVALTGDTVSLSTPGDATTVISPGTSILDGSGQATFTITSTQVGTDAITVDDVTTSTLLTALGNVIFDPVQQQQQNLSGGGGPSCSATAPTDAPNLYQLITAKTSVTLYFAPPSSTFDGFTISYGLTTDANTYAVNFAQGVTSGAVKYTINDLIPNGLYYFKVRATNGCAAGPWSGVLSTKKTTNQATLLVAGPSNLLFIGGIGGMLSILLGFALFAFL